MKLKEEGNKVELMTNEQLIMCSLYCILRDCNHFVQASEIREEIGKRLSGGILRCKDER